MKVKTYYLDEFCGCDFMYWSIFAQTATIGTITLMDDTRTYFSISKTTQCPIIKNLGQGSARYLGGRNLRLVVSIKTPYPLDQSINAYAITTPDSKTVGHGYNFSIEDGTDGDYNDYYIDIVAWNNKG